MKKIERQLNMAIITNHNTDLCNKLAPVQFDGRGWEAKFFEDIIDE